MQNNDFLNVGLFNWWPSATGVELAQEVKKWLQTYEIEEKDGFDGIGSLFGAENKPMNALEVSKWYERTGTRRNPDISETDYTNRSRETKYHLWFHKNVKVRLTREDFFVDYGEYSASMPQDEKIDYEIIVTTDDFLETFTIDNENFRPFDYFKEKMEKINRKTFFTSEGVNLETDWEPYDIDLMRQISEWPYSVEVKKEFPDSISIHTRMIYPLWFIPDTGFEGLGSLFGAEQEVQA